MSAENKVGKKLPNKGTASEGAGVSAAPAVITYQQPQALKPYAKWRVAEKVGPAAEEVDGHRALHGFRNGRTGGSASSALHCADAA